MNIEYLWLAGVLGYGLRWLVKHRERVQLAGDMTPKEKKLARIDRVIAAVSALIAYALVYPQMEQMVTAGMTEMALLLAASVPYNADSLVPKLMDQGRVQAEKVFHK